MDFDTIYFAVASLTVVLCGIAYFFTPRALIAFMVAVPLLGVTPVLYIFFVEGDRSRAVLELWWRTCMIVVLLIPCATVLKTQSKQTA